MLAKNQIKSELSNIRAIIGLGNPTDKYTHTYHNVGIHARIYIQEHLGDTWTISEKKSPKKTFSCWTAQNENKEQIYFIEPNTFMNESGRAVHDALTFFKIPLTHALVLHDDSDQKIDSYKISYNQRSAGHKGIESIIRECGSQEFWRGKIGIRPAQEVVRKKALEFVLKKITTKDKKILEETVFPKLVSSLFSHYLAKNE